MCENGRRAGVCVRTILCVCRQRAVCYSQGPCLRTVHCVCVRMRACACERVGGSARVCVYARVCACACHVLVCLCLALFCSMCHCAGIQDTCVRVCVTVCVCVCVCVCVRACACALCVCTVCVGACVHVCTTDSVCQCVRVYMCVCAIEVAEGLALIHVPTKPPGRDETPEKDTRAKRVLGYDPARTLVTHHTFGHTLQVLGRQGGGPWHETLECVVTRACRVELGEPGGALNIAARGARRVKHLLLNMWSRYDVRRKCI